MVWARSENWGQIVLHYDMGRKKSKDRPKTTWMYTMSGMMGEIGLTEQDLRERERQRKRKGW